MKMLKKMAVAAFAFMMSVSAVSAAEVSVDLGVDVVSQYVWRGMDQASAASVQPGVTLNVGSFSLGAWGSTSLLNLGSKELDFTLGYGVAGFSVSFTDYWWEGQGASYFHDGGSHYGELALGYEFGEKFPLSIGVSTMVYGMGDKEVLEEDLDGNVLKYGDRYFSTYISLGYSFAIGSVDMGASIGMTPFDGIYSNYGGFEVCSLSLSASKEIKFSEKFSLPVSTELIFSPTTDDAFLVVGISF